MSLLSTGALILSLGGVLLPADQMPTEENTLRVCRAWAGPDTLSRPDPALEKVLHDPAQAEALLRGRLLLEMEKEGIHPAAYDNVHVLCMFYLRGGNDTTQFLVRQEADLRQKDARR